MKQARPRELWDVVLLKATRTGVGQISTIDLMTLPENALPAENSVESTFAIRRVGLTPPRQPMSSRPYRPGSGASASLPVLVKPGRSPAFRLMACAYAAACALVVGPEVGEVTRPTEAAVPPHPANTPTASRMTHLAAPRRTNRLPTRSSSAWGAPR